MLTLVQIPFYLFAMSAAAWRLNTLLVSTMKAERENDRRARHDGLTGLLNRTGLFNAANYGVGGGFRIKAGMALLYLDLDGFKPVNDAYGHEAGDTLLIQVAGRLSRLAGHSALVARIGGDEFVIIGDCAGHTDARQFANTVICEIEKPFELAPDIVVAIGASVGIASIPDAGGEIDAVLRSADAAMYDAKRHRKGGTSGKWSSQLAYPRIARTAV